MKEFKLYLVEFGQKNIIKAKNYLLDCKIRVYKWQPFIVITYNERMFLSNDDICKAWTQIGNTFLQPKSCE